MKMKVYFSISAALILLTLLIDLSIAQQGKFTDDFTRKNRPHLKPFVK